MDIDRIRAGGIGLGGTAYLHELALKQSYDIAQIVTASHTVHRHGNWCFTLPDAGVVLDIAV